MARYGQQFKESVVARLLPPESSPKEAVSPTVGISVMTLERWRAEVLAKPSGDEARHWTPAARLEAVIETAAMNQAARRAWFRFHHFCGGCSLFPAHQATQRKVAIEIAPTCSCSLQTDS
jgi:transposase-like protein